MARPFVLSAPPSPSSTATSVLTYDSRASSPNSCIIPATKPASKTKTTTHRSSDPYTFGLLFPSLERLSIRHDDASVDGHLNLRVEITTVAAARPITLQLFHLKMHHLASRHFSLRRYGRDSGRDVCVCKRLYKNGGNNNASSLSAPAIRNSLSAILRSVKLGFRSSSPTPTSSSSSSSSASSSSSSSTSDYLPPPKPTDTIKLEFSNYARIAVRRRSRSKRYEFDWWGHGYAWKRTVDNENDKSLVSYHLVRQGQRQPLAYIVPDTRTGLASAADSDSEDASWVPPCSLWIGDRSAVDAGVAEIIVATGLIALVDDCIRQGSPHTGSGSAPLPKSPSSSSFRPHSDLKPRLCQTIGPEPRPPRPTVRSLFSRHSQTHRAMTVC
ncbi:hypothetical protein CP533_1796 [Ophiocordyceps camponoti-saundersi (nom. inval.)]|nr:hypothetical protein CP533_1796 [Ophiocordyceps camponoti-saundersi (nom. inval.)]